MSTAREIIDWVRRQGPRGPVSQDREEADTLIAEIEAAYHCIIDGTRAFAPPVDAEAVRRWFVDHEETIATVIEWKYQTYIKSVSGEEQ